MIKLKLYTIDLKMLLLKIIMTEQFLPIVAQDTEVVAEVNLDYVFEPSKEEIVEALIPKSLKTQLYKALEILLLQNTVLV